MGVLRIPRVPPSLALRRASLGYLLVWVLSPPLAYGLGWRISAALAMTTWLALEMISVRSTLMRPPLAVVASFAFVAYTLATEALVPDSATINRHFQVWIMLFFLVAGESFQRGREGDARFCFWLILIILPIWSATTLVGIDTLGGHVSRLISRSSQEAMELGEIGIGGFGFVYATVLALPFLIHLGLRPRAVTHRLRGRWRKRAAHALLLMNAIFGSLLVLQAGYSIALILGAIAFAFVVFIRSRNPLRFMASICVAGLLVVAIALAFNPVLKLVEEAAQGTEYSDKLADINASLEGGRSLGTVEGRVERYVRSTGLFLENPLTGTLKYDEVGKHSAILDRFAQYGIVIGALFLYLLVQVPLSMLRNAALPIGLAFAFFAVAVAFPMSNNIFMAWGAILYVFSRGALAAMGVALGASRSEERLPRGLANA